jgi:predicted enzyme related to lactoylglutathione lyase
MASIETLSEVILYVENLEEMVEFYTETIGLDIASGAPEHGFVAFDTGDCHLCLHAGRDGDIGPYAPKFVFEVEDVAATREVLAEKGVSVGEVREAGPGSVVCDAEDPEGNSFSIESSR